MNSVHASWYTAAEYARAIERLTTGRPIFGLGADIMSGFPGETDADHAATVALVESLPFTHLHVFPYSPRPGTAAERLGTPPHPETVRARAAELRSLGESKTAKYTASRIGGPADLVVIAGATSAPSHRKALTEDYLGVQLAGAHPRGSRLRATITGTGTTAAPLAP